MRIVLPVVVAVALAIYAFIDCGQTQRHRVRTLSKPVWLLIIVIPILGPVAWLLLGRPQTPDSPGPRPAPRRRPVAPDDDPEFLRRLRDVGPPPQREPPQDTTDPRPSDDSPPRPGEVDRAAQRDEADRRKGPETDPTDGDTR